MIKINMVLAIAMVSAFSVQTFAGPVAIKDVEVRKVKTADDIAKDKAKFNAQTTEVVKRQQGEADDAALGEIQKNINALGIEAGRSSREKCGEVCAKELDGLANAANDPSKIEGNKVAQANLAKVASAAVANVNAGMGLGDALDAAFESSNLDGKRVAEACGKN